MIEHPQQLKNYKGQVHQDDLSLDNPKPTDIIKAVASDKNSDARLERSKCFQHVYGSNGISRPCINRGYMKVVQEAEQPYEKDNLVYRL